MEVVEVVVVSMAEFADKGPENKRSPKFICPKSRRRKPVWSCKPETTCSYSRSGQVHAPNSESFDCLQKHLPEVSSPSSAARINAPVEQVWAVFRSMARASCWEMWPSEHRISTWVIRGWWSSLQNSPKLQRRLVLGLGLSCSVIIISCLSGKGLEETIAKMSTWRDQLTLVAARLETETQLPEIASSLFPSQHFDRVNKASLFIHLTMKILF